MNTELIKTFFTIEVKNNGTLEGFGNTLLKPLRVLFHGRSVILRPDHIVEADQTFCNFKLFVTSNKVILFIAAIFMTLPGIFVKGCAWAIPSVRNKNYEWIAKQNQLQKKFALQKQGQNHAIFKLLPQEILKTEILDRLDIVALTRFRRTSQTSYELASPSLKKPRLECLPQSILDLIGIERFKKDPLILQKTYKVDDYGSQEMIEHLSFWGIGLRHASIKYWLLQTQNIFDTVKPTDFGNESCRWGVSENGIFFIAFRYWDSFYNKEQVLVLYQCGKKQMKSNLNVEICLNKAWNKNAKAIDYLERLLRGEPCGRSFMEIDEFHETFRIAPNGSSLIRLSKPLQAPV